MKTKAQAKFIKLLILSFILIGILGLYLVSAENNTNTFGADQSFDDNDITNIENIKLADVSVACGLATSGNICMNATGGIL